jgi:pilus assembly protein CpaB
MNVRTIATLAVAILLGLVAVVLVRGYIGAAKPAQGVAASGGTVPVVVAAGPILRGQVLQPMQLKVARYPADSVPAGTFQNVSQLSGAGPTARLALRAQAANEPILADQVSAPGGKLTLSVALMPGMRAVSLRSGEVAGVGGFVLPGDRVDILLTRTASGENSAVTQVLAENVLVMGVDQSADDTTDKPVVSRTVTIQVTPDQAQTISLGQAVGTVSLSLRHVTDDASLSRKAVTEAQLGYFAPVRSQAAAAPRAARVAKPHAPSGTSQVTVARGTDISTYAVTMR